ncbi:MAG: phosphate regulon sensor histidine kinase PhoR [Solirubrobacteraceae bacterium]|nr:phosphate regulon sensor histidine kinase PhoR [Solirubrobacteraceae bacterium]
MFRPLPSTPPPVWAGAAPTLLAAVLLALVCGATGGPAWGWGVLAGVLALLLVRHLRQLAALTRWLADPTPATIPDGSGPWDFVFSSLYRQTRAGGQQQFRLTTLLARFRSAGEAMPDGVVILDAENHIEWANAMAERMFGIEAERDRGRPLMNLVRHPDFVAFMDRGDWGETPLLLELQRGDLMLSIRVVPYGQDEKLLLARDVTRFHRVETMRRDFVANVSHELKTPLTVLAGFQESLADGTVPPDSARGRHAFALMQAQTERMLRLVDDLLTLSQLESTETPASETVIDVAALLEVMAEEARALSGGRHQISLRVDERATLVGNEHELRSAFTNLVSNAIRYTPPGGRISLLWRRRDGAGVFSVEDSGIGVAAEHIPRLTERFYRVDRSRSRETGGTGLGLAIVKHVLTHHQATLEIESEPGRGSRFSAVFPAKRVRFRASAAAA